MIGAILGDIVGSRYEFKPIRSNSRNYSERQEAGMIVNI